MRLKVTAGLVLLACIVMASDRAVIIQSWLPDEGDGQDWGDGYVGRKDELWNDSYLAYEAYCARPGIDTNHASITMLWGQGGDFRRRNDGRYNPENLGVVTITDDSACIATVEAAFAALAGQMGPSDTLFCFTWGHGGHNDTGDFPTASHASHFSIGVRPMSPVTHLWDTAFGRMANAVDAQRVFIMQQCYSGGFVDDLSDGSTYVVCASAAGKASFSADNNSRSGSPWPEHEVVQSDTFRHAEFSLHLLNALRGKVPWPEGSSDPLHPQRADYNHDGVVSWEEAFVYSDTFGSTEQPVMHRPDSFWRVRASIPGSSRVKKGGALAATLEARGEDTLTVIYALKGNNTCEFWAYYVDADSWAEKPSIPELTPTDRRKVKDGGTLVAARNGRLYATKGSCFEFWEYDTAARAWRQLPSVPAGPNGKKPKAGTCCAAIVANDTSYVYLLKGNRTREVFRFNTVREAWEALDTAPSGPNRRSYKTGSCIAWDGGDTIFALKGYYNEFWAHSISSGAWGQRAYLPSVSGNVRAKAGSAMACYADKVYVHKGGARAQEAVWTFWRDRNGWSPMPSMAAGPSGKTRSGSGGSLVCAEGFLWLFRGNNTRDFYRLTPRRHTPYLPSNEPGPPPGPNEVLVAAGEDAGHPRWSPSCEWVCFSKPDAGGRLQVWKASAGGGSETQLTFLPGQCERPTWSPDGSRIAFEYVPDGSACSQIAVIDAIGTVSVLTSDATDHARPEWSLTGGHLVHEKDDSTGFTQVYRVPAAGGPEMAMTAEPVDHEFPQYCSPSTIVFQREGPNGFSQLYRLQTGSTVEVPLTFSQADHENPSVAAVGGIAVCEVTDGQGFSQIGKVSTSGGSEAMLTAGEFDFSQPSINPEGTRIHCVQSTAGGEAICEVDVDGGYVQLTDDAVERSEPHTLPADAPSTAVVYVRPEGIFRTSQAGGGGQSSGLCALVLEQVAPTPARGRMTIRWQSANAGRVTLAAYDVSGKRARVLASGTVPAGAHSTTWDCTDDGGRALPPGIYFCRLDAGGHRLVRKVVLGRAD
ncbi:hypothetical protein FJY71_02240 [candidate division WOR-3 bacterium]|nr:hypothetical protein [candidate division WOR-3 bacterium]